MDSQEPEAASFLLPPLPQLSMQVVSSYPWDAIFTLAGMQRSSFTFTFTNLEAQFDGATPVVELS